MTIAQDEEREPHIVVSYYDVIGRYRIRLEDGPPAESDKKVAVAFPGSETMFTRIKTLFKPKYAKGEGYALTEVDFYLLRSFVW